MKRIVRPVGDEPLSTALGAGSAPLATSWNCPTISQTMRRIARLRRGRRRVMPEPRPSTKRRMRFSETPQADLSALMVSLSNHEGRGNQLNCPSSASDTWRSSAWKCSALKSAGSRGRGRSISMIFAMRPGGSPSPRRGRRGRRLRRLPWVTSSVGRLCFHPDALQFDVHLSAQESDRARRTARRGRVLSASSPARGRWRRAAACRRRVRRAGPSRSREADEADQFANTVAVGRDRQPENVEGQCDVFLHERHGSSAASWNATPVSPWRVASAGERVPATERVPASAVSSPRQSRRIVDLPQPDGPISAVNDPGAQSSETLRSASVD